MFKKTSPFILMIAALATFVAMNSVASAQTNPSVQTGAPTPSVGGAPSGGSVPSPTVSLPPAPPPALTATENAAAQNLLNAVSTRGGNELVSELQVALKQYADQELNVKGMVGLVRAGAGNKLGLVNRAMQAVCASAGAGSRLAAQTCEAVDVAQQPADTFPEVGAVGGTTTNTGGTAALGPSTGNAVGNGNGPSTTVNPTGTTSTFTGASANVTPFSGTSTTTTSTPVTVYRMERSKALRDMKVDIERFGTRSDVPAIYRVDLRDPAGYFAARNFMMRDKDILFVSNAQAVELIKFLTVLNSVTASTAATPANAVTTRDALHQLGRGAHGY